MLFKFGIKLFVIILIHLKGIRGLRASLTATPSTVIRGGHTVLRCNYDLQGAVLYMVKFYKGSHEFYRFTPKDENPRKIFPSKGIYVDVSLSNHTQVMLKELEFTMAGNYSCEVSADEPSFSTAMVTTYLDIVYPPSSGPVIRTNKNAYDIGDTMMANCSIPKSKPAANLTFLINNQVMSLASKTVYQSDDGLEWSELNMSLEIAAAYFRGGRLVLRCVAQLNPVYAEYSTATFEALIDPKPERITSDASSIMSSTILIIMALFAVVLASVDYDVYIDDYTEYGNAMELQKDMIEKLIKS